MPKARLFHNPRCSKSRQALQLMQTQHSDYELEVIEYLKTPCDYTAIQQIFSALDIDSAMNMIRPKEAEFEQAGLSTSSSNEDILNAVVQYPKLLERPILLINERAAIGRPLENLEALING
ncbi:MAG: arsenate reductase (glutaredoxin) [Glaciecola sp.]